MVIAEVIAVILASIWIIARLKFVPDLFSGFGAIGRWFICCLICHRWVTSDESGWRDWECLRCGSKRYDHGTFY